MAWFKKFNVLNVDGPEEGKPFTEPLGPVCLRVNKGKPHAGGLDSIPGTQGSVGTGDAV